MSYPVRILPRAATDFRSIYGYIAKRSLGGAGHWQTAFERRMRDLSRNPAQFGLAAENDVVAVEWRQTFFKTRHGLMYRAVFTVRDETVFVLRIRGPGQPPLAEDELGLL